MSIDVVILQAGRQIVIRHWEESGFYPNLHEWKQTALDLARRAATQQSFRAEIFLCLKGHYLVADYGYETCLLLLKVARQYGWGSKIYIAVDEQVDFHHDQLNYLPQLIVWLDKVHHLQHRATDIVLANFNREEEIHQYHISDLRRAGDDSMIRYGQMSGLIIPDEWQCWAASSKEYGKWLEDTSEPDGRNLIIVIAAIKSGGKILSNAIKRAERKIIAQAGRRFALGIVSRNKLPPEVEELGAKYRLPILKFRGLLELRYFLLRLNRHCLPQAVQVDPFARTVDAVPVESRIFQLGNSSHPRLLITSTFHPDDRSGVSCLDAVLDVAEISSGAPARADCYVYPSLRTSDLPDLLKKLPDLTAWVFHGHGDRYGLKDFDGNLINIDEWFYQLKYSNVRLPLIVFSVCQSSGIARKFAQAGVRVAIGFENDVLPEICRTLAVHVVTAALESNGDQKTILLAYNKVCRILQGIRIFKPRAYYSIH